MVNYTRGKSNMQHLQYIKEVLRLERIRILREEVGLTQEQLADRLHVERSTVAGWEAGKRLPDIDILCVLADYFNTSIDYIVKRTDYR